MAEYEIEVIQSYRKVFKINAKNAKLAHDKFVEKFWDEDYKMRDSDIYWTNFSVLESYDQISNATQEEIKRVSENSAIVALKYQIQILEEENRRLNSRLKNYYNEN